MSGTTVRISNENHALLKRLSKETDSSMQKVLEQALKDYQKQMFWKRAQNEYEDLRKDNDAWNAEVAEQRLWDATLADGLTGDDC